MWAILFTVEGTLPSCRQTVCVFQENFNPFVMKIAVDFVPDTMNLLDRRLGLAAAILLCAIEGRQQ